MEATYAGVKEFSLRGGKLDAWRRKRPGGGGGYLRAVIPPLGQGGPIEGQGAGGVSWMGRGELFYMKAMTMGATRAPPSSLLFFFISPALLIQRAAVEQATRGGHWGPTLERPCVKTGIVRHPLDGP